MMCGHNNTIGLIIIGIEENYLHSFALSLVSIKRPLPSCLVMSHENTIAIANDLAARRPLLSLAVVVHGRGRSDLGVFRLLLILILEHAMQTSCRHPFLFVLSVQFISLVCSPAVAVVSLSFVGKFVVLLMRQPRIN